MPDSVGVIGAGLIGASIIARASVVWPQARLCVFDRSVGHSDQVAARYANVEAVEDANLLRQCDLVFVSTPVASIAGYVELLLGGDGAKRPVVIDTGSVKRSVADTVIATIEDASNYVPGHPLAGSHLSGPGAATPEIIDGRVFILTPTEATSNFAVRTARQAIEALGGKVVISAPALHDEILAITSHLPHVIAFALVEEFFAASSQAETSVEDLVAGSFRTQTAYAASDPELWADVLIANRSAMGRVLDGFVARLGEFRALAEAGDKAAIMAKIAAIRDLRKTIGDGHG